MLERIVIAIAWRLPKSVAYWATIRVMAHSTAGKYSHTIVPELLAMEVLDRWRD